MTLCLVTDRRRLGGRLDALLEQAQAAVDAGVDLLQIRERDLEGAALEGLVTRILQITRGSETQVVVNDRLDVALAAGADGVHLRGDSMAVSQARRLAPRPFLIGRSVHSEDATRTEADADYFIAGTVFPSPSKPDSQRCLGVDGLCRIVAATRIPVLAIGGITLENVSEAAAAGIAGIAAIGLFAATDPTWMRATVTSARTCFEQEYRRFDSVKTAP